jgi:hypothetical protein
MYNFWARKKECSSVFQIQSMDMWRNISLNNWDYLFCPIQSPNCKDSCFVLNPFKTRQELLQSHLNRWARDLMLKSQLHSEAMNDMRIIIQNSNWSCNHALLRLNVSTYFLPFMRDLKWVWRRSNCSLNHLPWVLYKSYEACEKGFFLLSLSSRKHLRSMLYIVKYITLQISNIMHNWKFGNIKIFHLLPICG